MASVQRCVIADVIGGVHQLVLVVFAVLLIPEGVDVYPSGAPSCKQWSPNHKGNSPQPNPSPYAVIVSGTSVAVGQSIIVTVSVANSNLQPSETNFKGFHLRAVTVSSDDIVGNFVVNDTESIYHALSCGSDTPKGAVTHSSQTAKTSVNAIWVAPANVDNLTAVIFKATVVQQFSTFWVDVKSVPVALIAGRDKSTSMFSSNQTSSSTITPSDLYDGCGTTKSCFGLPGGDKCLETSNCDVLATFVRRRSSDLIDVELMGAVGDTIGVYVGLGFSSDNLMGGDSVRECVINLEGISGSESFNGQGASRSNEIVAGSMELTGHSFADGVLNCKFSVYPRFVANKMPFDLFSDNYYVLLAQGPLDELGKNLARHTKRLASANTFNFTAIETSGSASINTLLVTIHGCLMVVSWVGTVSVAVFMARYYKQMWPEKTICKVKVWFACHRSLNMLTVLLSLAAFVVIVIHANGISSEWPANPHPVTGIVTIALMLLQPGMALFRCDPGSSRRPIFNWLHFIVGMVAVILAVVTMFFAVTLRSVDLPQYFWWILIAYVAFFVLTFANMEFFTCIGAQNGGKESIVMQNYPVSGSNLQAANPSRSVLPPASADRQDRFKQVMLILFVAGAIGFSAALVAVIATS